MSASSGVRPVRGFAKLTTLHKLETTLEVGGVIRFFFGICFVFFNFVKPIIYLTHHIKVKVVFI